MPLDLAELGLTQEELQERVVSTIANNLLTQPWMTDDDEEIDHPSSLKKQIDEEIKRRIDESVAAIVDKHILPNAQTLIENLTLQETNRWGEKKGEPVTFVEYLVQRAEAYMREMVDYDGKDKQQAGYHFEGKQTRLTYIVHHHLQYAIDSAMKRVIADGNKLLVEGLEQTCRAQLKLIADKLQVEVKTR